MIDGIPNRPLYFYPKDIIDGNVTFWKLVINDQTWRRWWDIYIYSGIIATVHDGNFERVNDDVGTSVGIQSW